MELIFKLHVMSNNVIFIRWQSQYVSVLITPSLMTYHICPLNSRFMFPFDGLLPFFGAVTIKCRANRKYPFCTFHPPWLYFSPRLLLQLNLFFQADQHYCKFVPLITLSILICSYSPWEIFFSFWWSTFLPNFFTSLIWCSAGFLSVTQHSSSLIPSFSPLYLVSLSAFFSSFAPLRQHRSLSDSISDCSHIN